MVLNVRMLFARHRLVGAAILCLVLVAACGPAPLGTGWPAVSLVNSQCEDTITQSIMVAFNDRIVQVNPADGKPVGLLNQDCEIRPPDADGRPKIWDFRGNAPNLFFSSPIKIDDDTVLAAAYNQHIYEIEFSTARSVTDAAGTPISERAGHTVSDLVSNGDLLYLGLSAKDLVALNSQDYQIEWTVPTAHGVWAKPLLVEDTLYFTSLDHYLYAVDAEDGDLRWKLDVGGATTSTPVLYNDRLFLGTFARKIFEISLGGEIINEYATVDWIWSSPVILDGILYSADLGGNVYALSAADGLTEIWKRKVAEAGIRPSPIVTAEFVVVGSRDHNVYWLDRETGETTTDTEGQPLVRQLTSPVLSDMLLVEPGNGSAVTEPYIIVGTLSPGELLVAYTLERGEYQWTYALS